MTNKQYVDSLLMIAAWYELHRDIPIPHEHCFHIYSVNSAEEVARIGRAFGKAEKSVDDTFFRLRKKFGELSVEVTEYREKVCVRKVVGTEVKRTEKQVPVAYKTEMVEEVIE